MMNILRSLLFVISFLYSSSSIFCQNQSNEKNDLKSSFYRTFVYSSHKSVDTIFLDEEITSLSISTDLDDDFNKTVIINEQDTIYIAKELHDPIKENKKFSQLIIFKKPIKSFIFKRGNIKSEVIFHLLNSGNTPGINKNSYRLKQGCGKPPAINQSEWREGLPAPNYTPVYSEVNHIIIHHSAGSNSDINFTYVVRQIYLYHTEVMKYSDIAYNFLIARDGIIYEGREGEEEREEDVIGAHFCGKNTSTMGVCLLGNYETAVPTRAMLEALEQLMAWKLSKENLDPFEAKIHPVGSTSTLEVIAGHRDGCPTLCPGENVYALMDVIRKNTDELIKNIGSEIPLPTLVKKENMKSGNIILEVEGGGIYLWFTSENPEDSIPGEHNSKYTTAPLFQDTTFYVAVKKGDCVGPRLKIDISVKEDQFHVFPNPSAGLITIIFNKSFKLSEFIVLNSTGQKVDFLEAKVKDNNIYVDTSILSGGVYILILKFNNMSYNKKLIVN